MNKKCKLKSFRSDHLSVIVIFINYNALSAFISVILCDILSTSCYLSIMYSVFEEGHPTFLVVHKSWFGTSLR
jgi:hypothetical protein